MRAAHFTTLTLAAIAVWVVGADGARAEDPADPSCGAQLVLVGRLAGSSYLGPFDTFNSLWRYQIAPLQILQGVERPKQIVADGVSDAELRPDRDLVFFLSRSADGRYGVMGADPDIRRGKAILKACRILEPAPDSRHEQAPPRATNAAEQGMRAPEP
jgi:hypothetical protein